MKTYVIALRRTPQRYDQFVRANAKHRNIERFDAVDGSVHTIEELQETGLVEGGLAYTPGAIGNALSHRQLWQIAIEKNVPITVCEDDACLHDDFFRESERIIEHLHGAWDVILWGWNFDSVFLANPEPNLSVFFMQFNQTELRANKSEYLKNKVQVIPLRLRGAFGTVCYSISPQGAQKFHDCCFPLQKRVLTIPEINFNMHCGALDALMCCHYRQMRSYACFPPLAVTDNDQSTSTVQPRR
jgi:GR25 family glycosyltransferase involved in LPS biosynthesis